MAITSTLIAALARGACREGLRGKFHQMQFKLGRLKLNLSKRTQCLRPLAICHAEWRHTQGHPDAIQQVGMKPAIHCAIARRRGCSGHFFFASGEACNVVVSGWPDSSQLSPIQVTGTNLHGDIAFLQRRIARTAAAPNQTRRMPLASSIWSIRSKL
jgi:hypothetical protein